MNKKSPLRYGSHAYNVARKKEVIKQEAQLNYRDKLKVYLSFTIKELEEMNHPIHAIVKKHFPEAQDSMTLDDIRFVKFFDKLLREGSIKMMELSFKLDGSMSELTNEPDYDEIDEATKGVK